MNVSTIVLGKKIRQIDIAVLHRQGLVLTIRAFDPPEVINTGDYYYQLEKIMVPKESLEAYKNAPVWSSFSDRIVPIYQTIMK